jgi:hypothetical protein
MQQIHVPLLTCDHFKQNTAKSPPVHGESVRPLHEAFRYFRCNIHGSPASVHQRCVPVTATLATATTITVDKGAGGHPRRKPEVAQLYVSAHIEQYILWL